MNFVFEKSANFFSVSEKLKALASMENDVVLMDNGKSCYFSQIIEKFTKVEDELAISEFTPKAEKKLIGRLRGLMNYITFLDLTYRCEMSEIAVSCHLVENFGGENSDSVSVLVSMAGHLTQFSEILKNSCAEYDLTKQYFSRWLMANM